MMQYLCSVMILLSLDLDFITCVTDADVICIPLGFAIPTISISFSEYVLIILILWRSCMYAIIKCSSSYIKIILHVVVHI